MSPVYEFVFDRAADGTVAGKGSDRACCRAQPDGAPCGGGNDAMLAAHRDRPQVSLRIVDGTATLVWDVRAADTAVLAAAVARAVTLPGVARCEPRFFLDGWVREVLADPDSLLARVGEIDRFRDVHVSTGSHFQAHELTDIEAESPYLSRFVCAWQDWNGHPSIGELADIVPDGLICTLDAEQGVYVPTYIGSCHYMRRTFGADFCTDLLWRYEEVMDLDSRHVRRVFESYDWVIARNRPLYHHVVSDLEVTDRQPTWVRYRRLVLPWTPKAAPPGVIVFGESAEDLVAPFATPAHRPMVPAVQ